MVPQLVLGPIAAAVFVLSACATTGLPPRGVVREANRDRFRTVVVRPPLIWGTGMPMLEEMVAAVEAGQFAVPDGGRQKMSTSHVDNVVECLVLAAERGRGGEAYFVTYDDSTTLGQLLADLLATRGMAPVERSVPFGIAWRMAALIEGAWRLFGIKSKPPVTRQTLRMIGQDFTLDIAKARRELGYAPVITRAEGLALMHGAASKEKARARRAFPVVSLAPSARMQREASALQTRGGYRASAARRTSGGTRA